jgi:predicted AlkP superfamily phosphohydrolase/phosphomutase
MRILVIGLDCAAPELLLGMESLANVRRLMGLGCYGRLESVIPPITVPAWMCMATSQDPGSLGIYGFRNRRDHGYESLGIANSKSITELAIWDHLAREGKRSIVIGVPPGYPPRRINGIWVGCFMTPDTVQGVYTHPPEVAQTIAGLVGNYAVDVKDFRTEDKQRLLESIHEMSRQHFQVVRHFLAHEPWDYFQFVEIGLDRIHHGFWKYHDPAHPEHEPGNPYQNAIRDYYQYLDEEIGQILELVDDQTIVLVVSDHGARALQGGVCVNEWLMREGLLVLQEQPTQVTPFGKLKVDWARTKVWSEGGYYARMFLNVEGREPSGTIPKNEVMSFRDELKARLEAMVGPDGEPLGTLVFKPEEIYREVRNVPPDLIVHFGGLAWRSIGSVGYGEIFVRENDTGPDDCNHAQFGAFVLSSLNNPLSGEVEHARLIDMAPTLLELGGYEVPATMQGRSRLSGSSGRGPATRPDEEAIIRQRLSGLGYI